MSRAVLQATVSMAPSASSPTYDLAIVGLGTAGAACAALAAQAGLKVVGLERKPRSEAGARWINGVATRYFDEAGLARPQSPELRPEGGAFHIVCGWGPTRVTVAERDVVDVDMRLLVERLQHAAEMAGAELRDGVVVDRRSGTFTLETSKGQVRARWLVDASGLTGAGLLQQGRPRRHDICAAAQEVRSVRDPAGARAFLEEHSAQELDTVCFTSVAGGYSIVNVRLEGDEVSLLTGSIPALGHPSGAQLLQRFVERHGWVGGTHFGGARTIPLSTPPRRLVRGRVALLGDAASQVFSAHGSGIGVQLVAARQLVDSLVEDGHLGGYPRRFRRRHGALLGAYDAFRRMSSGLSLEELQEMMSSGLMDAETTRAGLEQRLSGGGVSGLAQKARALAAHPRLARRFATLAPDMVLSALRQRYGV